VNTRATFRTPLPCSVVLALLSVLVALLHLDILAAPILLLGPAIVGRNSALFMRAIRDGLLISITAYILVGTTMDGRVTRPTVWALVPGIMFMNPLQDSGPLTYSTRAILCFASFTMLVSCRLCRAAHPSSSWPSLLLRAGGATALATIIFRGSWLCIQKGYWGGCDDSWSDYFLSMLVLAAAWAAALFFSTRPTQPRAQTTVNKTDAENGS
jgi:hypothetical protein